ncbi:MAG: ferredoxin [Gammaproteobacteria bacterium]|nr:MAG: ferredoxin [Gammaproteobacteria bacterium]RLA24497.1 MAG: ferredoxin [Gammaproteobacteria bacterium]
MSEFFSIYIEETGEVFKCSDGQHILSAMASMGKKGIPSGCHGGGCGVCKIRLLDGTYKTEKMSRTYVSEGEEEEGIALACRVFPMSDIHLSVIGKLRKNILKKTTAVKRYGFV